MPLILSGTAGVSGVDGSAGTPSYQGTDTNTGIFYPAADTIAFAEGGAEIARFDSSGNLGIGTSSPNARLSLGTSVGTAGQPNQLVLYDDATLANRIGLGISSGQLNIVAGTSTSTVFYTNGAERMRIRSDGVVAVGDTSVLNTSASLSVYSSLGAATGNPWTNNQITVGSTAAMAAGVGGLINLEGSWQTGVPGGATFGWIKGAKTTGTSGDATGDLILGCRNGNIRFSSDTTNSGLSSERMRIDSAGRVTMPFQPGFRAGLQGSTPSIAVNALWRFDTASGNGRFNTGNNYNTSTNTFTAPIAGRYYFHMQIITQDNSNGVARTDMVVLRINGAISAYSERRGYYVVNNTGDGGYYVDNVTAIFELSAGDTVNGVNASPSAATQHANGVYSIFEGYLLG